MGEWIHRPVTCSAIFPSKLDVLIKSQELTLQPSIVYRLISSIYRQSSVISVLVLTLVLLTDRVFGITRLRLSREWIKNRLYIYIYTTVYLFEITSLRLTRERIENHLYICNICLFNFITNISLNTTLTVCELSLEPVLLFINHLVWYIS